MGRQVVTALVYSIMLIVAGIIIQRHQLPPVSRTAAVAHSIDRKITMATVGSDKFVNDAVHGYYRPSTSPPPLPIRRVETSRLPLLLEEIPLRNPGALAEGPGLAGGALARVEDAILVMDRLGKIFRFDVSLNVLNDGLRTTRPPTKAL
jgi:hypothetical protein